MKVKSSYVDKDKGATAIVNEEYLCVKSKYFQSSYELQGAIVPGLSSCESTHSSVATLGVVTVDTTGVSATMMAAQ